MNDCSDTAVNDVKPFHWGLVPCFWKQTKTRALWGIHPACEVRRRWGKRRWICHCVPQTPARRDTADLMAWGSGVFSYAVVTSCMRLLMRGRLYDSQNMTHSSLWIQLSGFQLGHRLHNRASHHRAHGSAKLWHEHASELQWGSNRRSTYSMEEMSV